VLVPRVIRVLYENFPLTGAERRLWLIFSASFKHISRGVSLALFASEYRGSHRCNSRLPVDRIFENDRKEVSS